MEVDFDRLTRHECHKLLVGMVVPRPIAWVSTTGESATFNVAPFSFFGAVSPKPPIICLSVGSRQGQKKDTLRNIEHTQDFVVNVVDEILAKRMNQTSADYPSNVDEFKEANITPLSSDRVVSPRIAEAPINMECKLLQTIQFGMPSDVSTLIIGEIVKAHIRDSLFQGGGIDVFQLKAIGRLGGDLYCRITDVFEMKRPGRSPH